MSVSRGSKILNLYENSNLTFWVRFQDFTDLNTCFLDFYSSHLASVASYSIIIQISQDFKFLDAKDFTKISRSLYAPSTVFRTPESVQCLALFGLLCLL